MTLVRIGHVLFGALAKSIRGQTVLAEPEEDSAAMCKLAQRVYPLASVTIVG